MSLESVMVAAVKADSAIAAIVGEKVYPDLAPDDALPCLVYEQTGGGPLQAADGSGPDTVVNYRWTCRATTRLGVRALADALAALLDGWSTSTGTPLVSSCTLENESGDWDYRSDDSSEVVRIVEHEYRIWHT
jgi:hypothetical protein